MVNSPTLSINNTGSLAISYDFSSYLTNDLQRTSNVVFVVALLLLLIVFGTLVAAGLPLIIAVTAEVGGLAIGVNVLSQFTDVSQYATNLIALIGLGVAIDYSLFIVSRFREELAAGATVDDALAITMATAGRAIVFSGVTVGIGLCGLLFFQGTFLASMGAAGAIAVLLAAVWALTFLSALLAVLGRRVNWVRLPLFGRPPEAWTRCISRAGYQSDEAAAFRDCSCCGPAGRASLPGHSDVPGPIRHRGSAPAGTVAGWMGQAAEQLPQPDGQPI